MTPDQVKLIQDTFSKVAPISEQTAVVFYDRLFHIAPAVKATAAAPKTMGGKPSPESLDRAVQMLALLQRDGRLVDFLEEDVSSYPDGQLGAAVRSIHTSCRQVLERYLNLSRSFLRRKTSPSPCR